MNRAQILSQMKPKTIVKAQNCVMVEEIKGESNSGSKSTSKSNSSDSDLVIKKKVHRLDLEESKEPLNMSDENIQLRQPSVPEKIPIR